MNVISLKDYAAQKNISYEAVRQQVVRYKDDLGGHVIRDGRQQFLDEEAVAFLDAKRQKNPVSIIQMDKDEQIETLEAQVKELLVKTANQADRIAALSEWKAEKSMLLASAEQTKLQLQAAEEKNREQEREIADAIVEIDRQKRAVDEEKARADLKAAEAEKAKSEASEALKRAFEAESRLEEVKNLSFLKRIFWKG